MPNINKKLDKEKEKNKVELDVEVTDTLKTDDSPTPDDTPNTPDTTNLDVVEDTVEEVDNTVDELDLGLSVSDDTGEDTSDSKSLTEEISTKPNKVDLLNTAKLKPDFKKVAELFIKMDEAATEEDLKSIQTEYEEYLKETIVPKVAKAFEGDKKKAGVSSFNADKARQRVTTPLRNRK